VFMTRLIKPRVPTDYTIQGDPNTGACFIVVRINYVNLLVSISNSINNKRPPCCGMLIAFAVMAPILALNSARYLPIICLHELFYHRCNSSAMFGLWSIMNRTN